jgi:hypothetical protein
MIVTSNFVFIHIHKTGGQFINKAILDHLPGAESLGYHYPLSKLPRRYAHLPVIAFVRNPWDWYISWYVFNKSRGSVNPIYKVLSCDNTSDLKDTIFRLVKLGDGTAESDEFLFRLSAMLPHSIEGNRGSGITVKCIESLRSSGLGYFSWLVGRMVGKRHRDQNVLIGKYERLRNEFLDILPKVGMRMPGDMKRYLLDGNPINSTIRQCYQSYYDEELRLLIRCKDSDIVEKYGYQF